LAASASEALPVRPQDAEELGYREVCKGNMLQVQKRVNNTWNRQYCPSKLG
jgi:hypothetical protein